MSETKEQKEARLNARLSQPVAEQAPVTEQKPQVQQRQQPAQELPKHFEKLDGPAQPAPRIVWKAAKEFRHDLVKCQVGTMLKNVSYKKYQPQIEEVAHEHFFHSVDMQGNPNRYTQMVGGHFHEILIDWDRTDPKTGGPLITCGPALHEVERRLKSGRTKKYIEPVQYEVADGMDEEGE